MPRGKARRRRRSHRPRLFRRAPQCFIGMLQCRNIRAERRQAPVEHGGAGDIDHRLHPEPARHDEQQAEISRFEHGLIEQDAVETGGSQNRRRLARQMTAGADDTGAGIAGADGNRRSLDKPGLRCGLGRDRTGERFGAGNRNQEMRQFPDAEQGHRIGMKITHCRRTRRHRGLGFIGHQRAGQPVADEILGAEDMPGLADAFGFVLLQPCQDRHRTSELHHRAGMGKDFGKERRFPSNRGVDEALRPGIVPEDRRANQFTALVDQPGADHHPGNADATHMRCRVLRLRKQRSDNSRPPPAKLPLHPVQTNPAARQEATYAAPRRRTRAPDHQREPP
jgi:hypothetical protein